MLFDGKISEVEEMLLEASAEIRTLRAERRKAEAEEWRVSDTAGAVEAVSEPRSSDGQTRCPGELGVGVGPEGSQKRREAAVRKESAETQEYEFCQQMDRDEGKEELSSIPSAVNDSAGWHEPRSMCDGQCGRPQRAAHDEPLQGLLQFEANREQRTRGEWRILVGEKSPRANYRPAWVHRDPTTRSGTMVDER